MTVMTYDYVGQAQNQKLPVTNKIIASFKTCWYYSNKQLLLLIQSKMKLYHRAFIYIGPSSDFQRKKKIIQEGCHISQPELYKSLQLIKKNTGQYL